jgi:amino acid adenylation domain-containing protein
VYRQPVFALTEQQQLTRLWVEALELPGDAPPFAFESTFTDLGGDSISATLLLSQIKAQWRISLPIDILFENMTLPKLAALLEQRLAGQENPRTLPPITRQPRDGALPLSQSQRRMWLVQSFAPDTTAYNVTYALRLKGKLDRAALMKAVEQVWSRHDTFRTRVVPSDTEGQVLQQVSHAPEPIEIHFTDLLAEQAAQRESLAYRYLEQVARVPLDLVKGPLWHVHLLRLDEQDHILSWIAHHILIDLWGNQIIAREVAQVYSHLCAAQALSLPDVALDCADHGHWQSTPEFEAYIQPQLAYWSKQLAGLPPTNLATDHPMSPDWYRSAQRITHSLPTGWAATLQQFASRHGCTPFMVLLAGLAVMMGRQGRHDDVGILTPIANRHHADTAHLVASLVNSLVMRVDLSGLTTCQSLLERVKRTTLDAYRHQDLPFDILVEKLGSGGRGHQDLPLGLQVMLNVYNAPSDGIDFAGLDAQRMGFNRGATQLPLTFILDLEQTQTVALEYADSLFDPATAEALVSNYIEVLDQMMAESDQAISALHWRSASSRDKLTDWNNTLADTPHRQVDALLQEGAALRPDQIACIFGDTGLTYRQLAARASIVAERLVAQGMGPGQRIGIHLPRGLEMLLALRAVIMSGAAYVPLDPRYPPERLNDMIADAGLGLIIASSDNALGFDAKEVPVLPLHALQDDQAQIARSKVAWPTASPDDPLYIIYTSGSTGRPKGVVVPHRTVANFLTSMAKSPGITKNDKLLAVTTLSFDIAVLELLLPLSVGAQIVMASDDEVMDGRALANLLEQHHITMMQATPSTWRALLDSGWQGTPRLKALIGGEALRPELAQRLLPCCAELWNMYGPTETTVWSTCWQVDPQAETIGIGRPIANTRVRIVDLCGHECPIGTPGEIIIEGDGVALGYWRRPELTAERFIFEAADGNAAHTPYQAPVGYRTGDLGRWRHDGQLEHLGRIDHQIKIRGHRIEPGEIEHALMQHPQVAQAVVVTHEKTAGDVRLVAYVVKKQKATPTSNEEGAEAWDPAWRPFLRQQLPEHMVPQHLMALDALPLLANGKLNRRALPEPSTAPDGGKLQTSEANAASFTEWETRLIAAWREVLGVQDIRHEDNFFDLGGHSLLAMQVIEALARDTTVRIAPRRYIFETLAQLAASYEREAMTPSEGLIDPSASSADAASLGGKVKRWFKDLTGG